MIAYLEHDDFKKGRKALLISASLLLLVHYLDIDPLSTLDVLGLKLKINKAHVIGMLSVAVLYFVYNFLLRYIYSPVMEMIAAETRLDEHRMKRYTQDVAAGYEGSYTQYVKDGELEKKIPEYMMKRGMRATDIKVTVETIFTTLLEICPAIGLALVALAKSDGLTHVGKML